MAHATDTDTNTQTTGELIKRLAHNLYDAGMNGYDLAAQGVELPRIADEVHASIIDVIAYARKLPSDRPADMVALAAEVAVIVAELALHDAGR